MIDRDTVIALAAKAGMKAAASSKAVNAIFNTVPVVWLEKFASFVIEVAAAEKQKAVLAEREACAAACEQLAGMAATKESGAYWMRMDCASTIRARGTGGEG
ncbi:hypothetical protein [Comamonas sp. MYb69]|uniref:hypothetical protein n=1 Tax=Comamonas sp. MYb69 TaxID=1848650 RepID=UPI0030A424B2